MPPGSFRSGTTCHFFSGVSHSPGKTRQALGRDRKSISRPGRVSKNVMREKKDQRFLSVLVTFSLTIFSFYLSFTLPTPPNPLCQPVTVVFYLSCAFVSPSPLASPHPHRPTASPPQPQDFNKAPPLQGKQLRPPNLSSPLLVPVEAAVSPPTHQYWSSLPCLASRRFSCH